MENMEIWISKLGSQPCPQFHEIAFSSKGRHINCPEDKLDIFHQIESSNNDIEAKMDLCNFFLWCDVMFSYLISLSTHFFKPCWLMAIFCSLILRWARSIGADDSLYLKHWDLDHSLIAPHFSLGRSVRCPTIIPMYNFQIFLLSNTNHLMISNCAPCWRYFVGAVICTLARTLIAGNKGRGGGWLWVSGNKTK